MEIAEITRRVAGTGDAPVLLFDRVRGHASAVITNVLGTEQRVCWALDLENLGEIPSRLETLIRHHTPQNWFDRLKMARDSGRLHRPGGAAGRAGSSSVSFSF